MMRQMRENTKIIMLITALAFVALMVFEWGMDMSGQNSAQISGGEIGIVGGEPVLYQDFNQVYRSIYDRQAAQQDGPITPAQNRQIEDAAWDQLVTDRVVEQEIRRRGITASEEEIRQAARFSPPPEFYSNELFLTNGQFDLTKYHEFLASPAVDAQLLQQLEAYYRSAIPRSKLFRQVVAGLHVTDQELWRMWRDRNEQVTAEFFALDPETLVDDAAVGVTEQDVRKYYEDHKDELTRPARAAVQIVALQKAPLAADSAQVFRAARELRQAIVAGRDFAEAAREVSTDGSAEQGGDLGTVRRGETVPAFEQAAFSLPIGEVSEPVLSPFGYHLIKVNGRGGDSAQVSHILFAIERDQESEDLLLERADSLEMIGERSGLAAAAEAMGLRVRDYTISEGTAFVPGIGALDEGEDWALVEGEQGQTSPVFENDDYFYMLQLGRRTPAGTMTFEETQAALRQRVIAERKLERAKQTAREAIDRIRAGSSIAEQAARLGVSPETSQPFSRVDFVPGLGAANPAIGTAFGLAAGQVGGPAVANDQVFVIRVLDRTEADRNAWSAQKDDQRERVLAALEQSRVAQFIADLRTRAKVQDRRAEALRAPATAANTPF